MSILVPDNYESRCFRESEKFILESFKKYLSDDWLVFYSFNYFFEQENLKDDDLSLVAFHPAKGLVCVDFFNGNVEYKNNILSIGGAIIDPLAKMMIRKYAIKNLLEKYSDNSINIEIKNFLCFHDCGDRHNWPEKIKENVLTGTHLAKLDEVFKKAFAESEIDCSQWNLSAEQVVSAINGAYAYGVFYGKEKQKETSMVQFNNHQQYALEMIQKNRWQRICGEVATGKTTIAMKTAIDFSSCNKRVLFLCYNDLVAKSIAARISTIKYPNIDFFSWDSFCCKLAEGKKTSPVEKFYNNKYALDIINKNLKDFEKYDVLIVDEGEEFSRNDWKIIKQVFEYKGNFYLFFDLKQDLDILEKLPTFPCEDAYMTEICRGTKNIFAELSFYLPADNFNQFAKKGLPIVYVAGSTKKERFCLLKDELSNLIHINKYKRNDIVILGVENFSATEFCRCSCIGDYVVTDGWSDDIKNGIPYYEIKDFKGCESKVVVIYNLNTKDSKYTNENIATLITRAKEHLVIISKKRLYLNRKQIESQ